MSNSAKLWLKLSAGVATFCWVALMCIWGAYTSVIYPIVANLIVLVIAGIIAVIGILGTHGYLD